jgi:hypothetical protein
MRFLKKLSKYKISFFFSLIRYSHHFVFGSDPNEESKVESSDTSVYRENILFVYLDLDSPVKRDLIGSLRIIHDNVQIYSDLTKFLNLLEDSNDRIFLISAVNERDLIEHAHDCPAVVAIFIWNSDGQIDRNRFPKLFGSYENSEELLTVVRNGFEWFEQTQLELIVFERDQLFLWLQLWKEV